MRVLFRVFLLDGNGFIVLYVAAGRYQTCRLSSSFVIFWSFAPPTSWVSDP